METKIFVDFAEQLKDRYRSTAATIYYRVGAGAPVLMAGDELPPEVLETYFDYSGPKYIVSESAMPIKNTDTYFSRFVFGTKAGGVTLLFVLSTEQRAAYDDNAGDIVNDIMAFKEKVDV